MSNWKKDTHYREQFFRDGCWNCKHLQEIDEYPGAFAEICAFNRGLYDTIHLNGICDDWVNILS